jgi:hypothetical protein
MIEPLESREFFSATLTTADTAPAPVSAKPLLAWYVEELDAPAGDTTAPAAGDTLQSTGDTTQPLLLPAVQKIRDAAAR